MSISDRIEESINNLEDSKANFKKLLSQFENNSN